MSATPYRDAPNAAVFSFKRASLFGEDDPLPDHHDIEAPPDWLDDARDALVRPGDYLAFEDDERVRVVPLQEGWTRIGRSLSAHIRFDDPTVSRRHALVYCDADGARILDDRSLNGVFRNGDRVELGELEDGDEIDIGRFRVFYVSLVALTAPRWPASSFQLRQALLARLDRPVAELALGPADVDRALLGGDPDREARQRRRA